ncbi:MAG: GNAT family N-acetyltransferase [Actinomycetota bacterium]|nr:GNAT family N-acetyltransferase [Actinomycetota bacterium]
MNTARDGGRGGGLRLELRPTSPADREFLYQVYAGTRAEELAVVDWPAATIDAFLRQQFEAQDHHYRRNYPGATFDVIVVDGQRAGRLYVQQMADETRVMDIALLPAYRGQGVGKRVLGDVLAAAGARGVGVTIHVERNNRALPWYQRLGFSLAGDRGVYLFLRWLPASEV